MTALRRFSFWLVLLSALVIVTIGVSWSRSSASSPPAAAHTSGVSDAAASTTTAQEAPPARLTVDVAARRYQFTPARIDVRENDLVKIVFKTEDIPHSFTIDAYRIAKRAAPGRPVTFEFLADKAGTFVFYCNLTTEEGCKKMRGELVVRPR